MTKEELEKACKDQTWLVWNPADSDAWLVRAGRYEWRDNKWEHPSKLRLATPNDMLKYDVLEGVTKAFYAPMARTEEKRKSGYFGVPAEEESRKE